jgi:alpha 1,6-mannosyltransferase
MLISSRPPRLLFAITFIALSVFLLLQTHIWRDSNWQWTSAVVFPSLSTNISLIPEKIWYKLGPKGLNNDSHEWIEGCRQQNPSFQIEFLTDLSGDIYVKEHFSKHPDIVSTYLAISVPILKADFLRYLILFADGGMWSDLDVSCEGIPIREWIPEQYRKEASIVVGWEFDVGWWDNFERQFATWTIMAKPGSPHMWMVIRDIVKGLHDKASENNVALENLTMEMAGEVVDLTGPRRMTRSVFKSLNMDYSNITGLQGPMLINDLLLMPGYSFANSTNNYPADQILGPLLVTHHYAGTWKNKQGGETA